MANCMLEAKRLILYFWAKDITCAKYIVNHIPTKALKDITLDQEAWCKIKLYVSDLDLCRNATEYTNNHRNKFVAEIKLHLINQKTETCLHTEWK